MATKQKTKKFKTVLQKKKLFRANDPMLSVFMWGVNYSVSTTVYYQYHTHRLAQLSFTFSMGINIVLVIIITIPFTGDWVEQLFRYWFVQLIELVSSYKLFFFVMKVKVGVIQFNQNPRAWVETWVEVWTWSRSGRRKLFPIPKTYCLSYS